MWGDISEIEDLPGILVERLRHYFLTYKDFDPGTPSSQVSIKEVYGAEQARKVISAAMLDYEEAFGD